jgi:hypothetical protein
MEIFKFIPNPSDLTSSFLEQGEFINGIKTATWTERYRPAGEFTITAPVSADLRTVLPLGTLISHTDTLEVMMVENHEIDDDAADGEPMMRITGSSLETWFKFRGVGADVYMSGLDTSIPIPDYVLDFDNTWNQAAALINLQIILGFPTLDEPGGRPILSEGDEMPGWVGISNEQHTASGTTAYRIIERGSLYRALLDLMAIDDFGIKVVRPNPDNVDPLTTEFRIHNGADKTADVIFSHVRGDLTKARYFWSNKAEYTDAFIVTSYLNYRHEPDLTAIGYNRRILHVDAADLDSQVSLDPDGYDFTDVYAAGNIRAADAIRASRQTSILATNITSTAPYKFRRDYDVGDLVTVNGNYDVSAIMRVTEHVEFLDEKGTTGYPTLSALGE